VTDLASLLPPAGTLAGEAARAALVAPLFLLLFVAAETWRKVAHPPTEWTRKAVHTGGGVIAAGFPWIFAWHWTVLALGAAFGGILWGTRKLGLLQSVHGVERRSEGGLYYPLAIYLLFLIAAGTPAFYLVAILALVVSDTVAALVGTHYGRITFSVEAADRRSLEGSAVFFLATFLGVHLPLLLLTDTGRAASVLIALQVALIVTFFEAVCLFGSDNLVVPLATYFLLVKMTPRTAEWIGEQLLAQLLLIALVSWVALRWRVLTVSGAIGATLFFYGAYSLGGPEWVVAPALALAGLVWVFRHFIRGGRPPRGDYQVSAVFYSTIVAAALVVLNNALETLVPAAAPVLRQTDALYGPYVGVLAGHLAMLALTWRESDPDAAHWPNRLRAAALGVLCVVPVGIAAWSRGPRAESAAAAVAVALIAFVAYAGLRWWPRAPRGAPWELRLQMISTLTALALVLPGHLWVLLGR
jgi:phytol kinase